MNNPVLVSVLMSVYNTDFQLVKRAIDSVLTQTFQDFELIVIDDGSQKDNQNQLLNYIKIHESKITYIRHKNCGQSQSINRGVLNSRGKYIAIIDADDEYKAQHLEKCLAAMQKYDLVASTTETITDSEDDYYVPDKNDPEQLIHVDDCILFATLFGKKEVFSKIVFENGYAADAFFYEEASKYYKVAKIELRTYVYYRNNPDSICSVLKRKQLSSSMI